ncbi:MAG: 50S ribosomal protein L3 N(5)-glutamine methyltransferase [Duodenibacillus sp.]|nr:50S ribosomal protein L3 N(5)-glutamine methyltransferase [Duodenibacillus sp.]
MLGLPASDLPEPRTVCDLVRFALTAMGRAGVELGHGSEDFWQEATFLVLRTIGLEFSELDAYWDEPFEDGVTGQVINNIRLRVTERLPAAYVVHEAWLQGRPFYVDRNVLIPRSFIAELLEERLAPWCADPEAPLAVLDLCTGSGCLAILAAQAFPAARVTGSDISEDALAVAGVNRAYYGLEDTLELVQGDLFSGLAGRRFDIIVSNPPYVTEAAMRDLPGEYRHEPELALVAGPDGMDVMRRMIPGLAAHLNPGGFAVIEIGDGKDAFEAAWPGLPVTWLTTSGGDGLVLLVREEDLPRPAAEG